MALSTFATQTALSVSTTELSIISGTSSLATDLTDGWFCCNVDLSNVVLGDTFEIRFYNTVRASGTKRVVQCWTFYNAQGTDSAIFISPSFLCLHGFDFTLKRTAGADRTMDCAIYSAS